MKCHTDYRSHAYSRAQGGIINISVPWGSYLFKRPLWSEDLNTRSKVKTCTLTHLKHRFYQQWNSNKNNNFIMLQITWTFKNTAKSKSTMVQPAYPHLLCLLHQQVVLYHQRHLGSSYNIIQIHKINRKLCGNTKTMQLMLSGNISWRHCTYDKFTTMQK